MATVWPHRVMVEKKDEFIKVRVTRAQKAELTAFAKAAGFDEVSTWLRWLGLRCAAGAFPMYPNTLGEPKLEPDRSAGRGGRVLRAKARSRR